MSENKFEGENFNLVKGEIKETNSDSENVKNFILRWESKIDEIKKISLDNNQSYNLANDFLMEWDKFMHLDAGSILSQLGHDLFLAISIANNNYKKEFPSFWQNFHKLNLPDLHFHKK